MNLAGVEIGLIPCKEMGVSPEWHFLSS
jgi:hypothetical protein